MRINTNISSLTAQNANTNNNKNVASSLEKLSTGLKINRAADDASGLAIADKLRTQASGLNQSINNGNSAIAMMQIADNAMAEQSNILDIVKTKLIQAATATTTSAGITAINKDIEKLMVQINNIAGQTNYNGKVLLQDSAAGKGAASAKIFQLGEKGTNTLTAGSSISANTTGLSLGDLSSAQTKIISNADARGIMSIVDTALTRLNGWRSDIGSSQSQIESSVRNMGVTKVNIQAAESVIRDVDYAQESANFNKLNIIAQAGTYAISQANAAQQNVMRLLQ